MRRVAAEPRRSSAEESDLIRDAQAGDRDAFALVVERYWEPLFRYLYHLSRDNHAAEDLAQESFLKAFAALDSFRLGSNFRAWLFRIASNAISDHYRREAKQKELAPSDPPQEAAAIEEADRRAQVYRNVAVLPADQRRVIQLRFAEEKSIREVAEALGRSEGAVKQLQFRALQTLRERMRQSHV